MNVDFFCYVCNMHVVMLEKISPGYEENKYSITWRDELGRVHRKHGPAYMGIDGRWEWFVNGKFIDSINVEDDDVQIQEILQEFNFKKVHKVMKYLDWKWQGVSPSLETIKSVAETLLNNSKVYRSQNDPYPIETGGFRVSACKNGFSLEFIVESVNSLL